VVREISARELCSEMLAADLGIGKQHALLGTHGYQRLSTGDLSVQVFKDIERA
jgi:hypothetical protein